MLPSKGKVALLENASASAAAITGDAKAWPGGVGIMMAEGTFGSQTMSLQFKSPQGTWIAAPSITLSANGIVRFELPPGQIRAVVSSGSPSGLYAYAIHMGE